MKVEKLLETISSMEEGYNLENAKLKFSEIRGLQIQTRTMSMSVFLTKDDMLKLFNGATLERRVDVGG